MVNPKTGWITREWEIEIITTNFASGNKAAISSAKHPTVSEAYLIQGAVIGGGTVAPATGSATVIAHDVSFPPQGTVGATQVATLAPQQFLVAGFAGASAATQLSGVFAIRGR